MRILLGIFALLMSVGIAAAQGYSIKSGDVLTVEVLEDSSLNRNVLVLPDGSFSFPYAGTVSAGGRTLDQVQANLRTALAPNFATTPTVFVSLNQLAPATATGEVQADLVTVYFLGEVQSPGPKQFEPGISFLQALSGAGGFTAFAAQKRVQLRRTDQSGQEHVYKFNLRAIGDGATIGGNTTLRDGDVILVPERRLFE
ncbi:polysaccharide biosynthesis/export family protein [Qingshengfaniella alkalisoli]|uniref:Polysaccharide export protein n=1 Tax=Qingshengfaniella alkalisoli TaxID=2599296 RepID=A0A5B8J5K4_9RHOB|nr:polysaccharide biosynthesis/export family protein [Qingshengfaniella alkalisoli]QDY69767.1 polysaccharide export protein [Qingshengfaniella alkalisoli]